MKAFFVTKRLAFGSAVSSFEHVRTLRAQGFTHVINLRWHENGLIDTFNNLWLAYRDDLKERPPGFYRRALAFYQTAMALPNSKLFVMCHHGYRRSPALVYFFLRCEGVSPELARKRVAAARSSVRVATPYRQSTEKFLASSSGC